MKKKIFGILICGFLLLGLTGCGNDKEKVYQIGDTISKGDFEFTLLDVQYGNQASKMLGSEDYLLPKDNFTSIAVPTYYESNDDETYVIITYTMKFNGKEKIDILTSDHFKLIYDKDYTIEDSGNTKGSAVRNSNKQGDKDGNSVLSLWNNAFPLYEFKPLSDTVTFRELITVPSNIIDDKEKSLTLVKDIKPSASSENKENNTFSVEYKLK